jgi:site-specific DNA-methyltransferase (adenine-specific)
MIDMIVQDGLRKNMLEIDKIYCSDCLDVMKDIPDKSIDLIVTDPPYGYSFMGKDWDKAVIGVDMDKLQKEWTY